MNKNSFAIITPSYAPDFERCKLLCESIENFVNPRVKHYIVVDAVDLKLFRSLENQYTEVITKECILPKWIVKLPLKKNIWFNFRGIPIRGWLIQQIIKIAVAKQIEEDISVFVDSDVVFVRSCDFSNLLDNNDVRLFREPVGNDKQKSMHRKWHESASNLLGLSEINPIIPDYIGHLITWKTKHVKQMCEHIERVSGKDWISTLASCWNLSEYVLYGTFIEQILQKGAEHYYDSNTLSLDYWYEEPLSKSEIQELLTRIQPEQVAVMISAKAGISVQEYKSLLQEQFKWKFSRETNIIPLNSLPLNSISSVPYFMS